jgi:Sulfatase
MTRAGRGGGAPGTARRLPTTGGGAPGTARRLPKAAKTAGWAYLNLAVLWTFAVAQPLFDLLKDNPEFFAARGSSGFDIISFSVLLVVLPPAILLAIELLLGLIRPEVRQGAHIVFLGALVALIAAQALKKAIDASDPVLIVLSVLIGAGIGVLWARAEPVRSFLNVLSPVPLVFLLLFLLSGQISELAFPSEAKARSVGGVARAPIVVVLLDELPSNTLVDEHDRIDAKRFPGFGELARTATWFRNAYTVYDSTERAQPAIMDGNLPEKDKQPISSDHPNSIFSLFAKTHRMNVDEEATAVCSRDICTNSIGDESYGKRMSSMAEDLGLVWLHVVSPPDIENDLTSVSENWGNFGGGDQTEAPTAARQAAGIHTRANLNRGRSARFQEWMQRIVRGRRPALNFKHTLMPHVPWQYMPTGRLYRRQPNDAIPGLSTQAYEDQGQLDVLLQRHFLQTGFADYELQQLWKRLKSERLWDESLIVVAADHGVAFPHARERRRLNRQTAREIAPIPLLIKAPGQKRAKIDNAWVETIDILPTIFDILNLDPRVKMDGRSAFSPTVKKRDTLRFEIRNTFQTLRIPADTFAREREQIMERNHRLFGSGADGPERIYEIGPHPELIGQPSSAAGPKLDVDLAYGDEYTHVDPASGYVPVHVVGTVSGPDRHPRDIAVAVNGTIRAVGNTFRLAVGDSHELVSVMVPESAFHKGRNQVEVFLQ